MPRRYTMTDLVLRAQRRVDQVNDGFISRDEWCAFISEAYGELYMIPVEAGLEYFEYRTQLTTDGSNVLAEMPDHLGTVVFARVVPGTNPVRYRKLHALQAEERVHRSGVSGSCATAYAMVDDEIYLYPTPPAGDLYEMRYCPQPPELVEFNGELPIYVDVVTPDGLTFLLWSVAVLALAKSEQDPQLAMQQKEAARERFTTSVQMRRQESLRRMVDRDDDDDAAGFGGYGW